MIHLVYRVVWQSGKHIHFANLKNGLSIASIDCLVNMVIQRCYRVTRRDTNHCQELCHHLRTEYPARVLVADRALDQQASMALAEDISFDCSIP